MGTDHSFIETIALLAAISVSAALTNIKPTVSFEIVMVAPHWHTFWMKPGCRGFTTVARDSGMRTRQSLPRRRKFNENIPCSRNRYTVAVSAPQVGNVRLRRYERFNNPEENDPIRDGWLINMCFVLAATC